MANALSGTARSAWAEHSSSGSAGNAALRSTGNVDSAEVWKRVQEQACRSLVSDPDIVFYLAFLASNRAYKTASPLSAQIDALVLAAEGSAFKTPPVEMPAAGFVVGSTSSDSLRRMSDVLVQRAVTASVGSKLGKRQAIRGDEALAEYRAGLDKFLLSYKELQKSVVLLSNLYPFSFEGYRTKAVAAPLARAEAALSTSYTAETASSFVAQNAAAAAALTMVGREPALSYRLRYDQVFTPPTVAAEVAGTSVVFTKGTPDLVFARIGDVISSGSGTAVVTAVGPASLTLNTALTTSGAFRLVPGPLTGLETMIAGLKSFILESPEVTQILREELARLDTAASVNTVIALLAQIQAVVSGVSSTVEGVLIRRGIETPTATPLQTTLLAYSPSLPKKTRDAGIAIVDVLEQNGFSYAASCVLSGDPTILLSSAEASYPGANLGAIREAGNGSNE